MVIIAVDTETEGLNTQKFVLGCTMKEGGETIIHRNYRKMYDYLINEIEKNYKYGHRTFIYAHNHQYDYYAYAKDHLGEKEWQYYTYTPFFAKYKNYGYFLDTLSFYKMPLKELGDKIGLPKADMPLELVEGNIDETAIWKITPYCMNDTKIVLKAIQKLRSELQELGNEWRSEEGVKPYMPRKMFTAGQVAISSFLAYSRARDLDQLFMEGKGRFRRIIRGNHDKDIRPAYRGGRVEAFQTGEWKNCTLIDINSLYPFVMTKMPFPALDTNKKINNKHPSKEELKGIGVLRGTLKAPKKGMPYLPVRWKRAETYQNDIKMTGVWSMLEVRKAIELGYKLINTEWFITWDELEQNPLKEYMKDMYKLKQKHGETAKLIMNNLHGKFAQWRSNKEYKIVHRADADEWEARGWTIESDWGEKYVMTRTTDKYTPLFYAPILSILTTAYSRDLMYDNMCKIKYDDLLYTDTDSILFKGNNIKKYKIGNKMGEFKIAEQGNCKILGEKKYWINDKLKFSGLRKADLNKEIMQDGKVVTTKRMITLPDAIKKGRIEDIGKFEDFTMNIMETRKIDNIIMETLGGDIDETKEYGAAGY